MYQIMVDGFESDVACTKWKMTYTLKLADIGILVFTKIFYSTAEK